MSVTVERRGAVAELARIFLRLGVLGFGGPAVHVAMMLEETVRRRRWLTEEEFLDLLGATNLIPGPNSTEMAIHIGYRRGGWPGLAVAGSCFALPAVVATGVLAWAYVRFGAMPGVGWLLYGVKPAMLAVVVQAIATLFPTAAGSARQRAIAACVAVLAWLGGNEIALLLAAGVAGMAALSRGRATAAFAALAGAPAATATATATAAAAPAAGVALPALFWVFFKTGSVLFGSGYVLLAFLEEDLVRRTGWLTQAQLIDAIAVGQLTPGPVSTTATFVGFVLAGLPGAAVATAGMFVPAFLFVAASLPLLARLRASPLAAGFLGGVHAAALALMAVVTAELARAAIVDFTTAAIGAASLAALLARGTSATWLVVGGGLCGWLAHVLGTA